MVLLGICLGLWIAHLNAEEIVLPGQNTKGTLVELYASEACSSCPPAEKWLSHLKNDPRLWKEIFPVAFHVDYWDNLGWPDRFASKAYTLRQGDYAKRWNAANLYTPEFIVDGREWRRGFGEPELPLAKPEVTGPLQVVIQRDTGSVRVSHAPIASTASPHLTIHVAWLGMNISSEVKAGENGGRTLVHDFVVLDFQSQTATFTKEGISAEFSGPVIRFASDHPAAAVAWISGDDGSIMQVTGGLIK